MKDKNKKTVLIVDDEAIIAMKEARVLEKQGYNVLIAHSGEEAVKAASQHPIPDLILMDIDLGSGMDGTRAAEIILKNLDIPVLFLSSHTEPAIVEKTERITSYGYVVKNSGDTVLLASIKMAFKLHDAHLELKKHETQLTKALADQRLAEEALLKSEERYRSFFEKAATANTIVGEDTIFILVNSNFEKLTGYTKEELEGRMSWTSFVVQEDLEKMKKYHTQRMSGTESPPHTYEFRAITKSGEIKHLHLSISMIPGAKESISSIIDITELKRTEDALRQNEERFHDLAKFLPESVFETDAQGRITFVNQNSLDRFGYAMEEVVGRMTFMDVVDPGDHPRLLANVAKIRNGEPLGLNEYIAVKKNGTRFPVLVNSTAIVSDGKTVGLRGFLVDITERKKAEEALCESEERFSDLANLLPETVFETDLQGRITFVNDPSIARFGYTREEVERGLSFLDIIVPEEHQRGIENFGKALRGELSGLVEYTARTKNGTRFPVLINTSIIVRDGQPAGLRGFLLDITERKRTEEELRMFRYTIDQSSEMVLWLKPDGGFEYVNEEACRSLGYTREELIGMKLWDIDPVLPRGRLQADISRFRENRQGGSAIFESMHRRKDGSEYPVEVRSQFLWFGEREMHVGVVRDITERKRAGEALRESEERFSELARLLPEVVFETDMQGRFTFVNQVGLDRFGYTMEDVNRGVFLSNVIVPEDRERALVNIGKMLKGEKLGLREYRVLRKNGSIFPVLVHSTAKVRDGVVVGLRGFLVDITEHKKTEEALRESEERWQFALEGAGDGVWDWNAQTNRVHFSRQWKAMLGHDDNEIGDTLDEWDSRVHPDDREHVYTDLNRHFEGKTPMYANEHRIRCKNGEYKWILDRGKVITRTPDGRPIRVIGTHTDITRRRQAEERYTTFMRAALDGFAIFDQTWRIVEVNDAYARMTGYSREELMGVHISELEATLHIDEISSIYETLQKRGSIRFETRHKKKDGNAIDIEVSIRLQEDEKQNNLTFVIIRDISEKKKAESALENSVREKESLFHELQHRTKNSLNMITSLISLEMHRPENEGAREVLENLKGRILSVANLYTILSMSDVAKRVNLDDYIRSIAASVAGTFLDGTSAITIKKECEQLSEEPKNAMAWGLIANELLTNALKYAFPPRSPGVIRVRLRNTNGSIELAVSDNGSGPAADFDIERPKGFGLLLVNMLARQLGGTFTFERTGENVFSVRVPAPPAGRGPGGS